jgi:nitroreductase / dihydropteridine reductase
MNLPGISALPFRIKHAEDRTGPGYGAFTAAMIAAAFEGVDSTPMEGFDPDALDEILELREHGLRSVAMLPLGYREADKDCLVNLKKLRRPLAEFVTRID